jgi:hypothetical protein
MFRAVPARAPVPQDGPLVVPVHPAATLEAQGALVAPNSALLALVRVRVLVLLVQTPDLPVRVRLPHDPLDHHPAPVPAACGRPRVSRANRRAIANDSGSRFNSTRPSHHCD